jgi:large subunit ribosomal protein L13
MAKKVFKNLLTSRQGSVIMCKVKKLTIFYWRKHLMSTYFANAQTIERKWYVIDAANKPLGRTAVAAANILRGKHRPEFTPHADCGEFVIIINADKAVLTGRKLEQKYYYHHSGYIGGMKSVQYKTLMATKPELAMTLAVKGMLPHNTLGAKAATRLKVYAGANHKHEAQKPVAVEV